MREEFDQNDIQSPDCSDPEVNYLEAEELSLDLSSCGPVEEQEEEPVGLSSRQYVGLSILLVVLTLATVLFVFFLRNRERGTQVPSTTPIQTDAPASSRPDVTPDPFYLYGKVEDGVYVGPAGCFQMKIPTDWRMLTNEEVLKLVPREYPVEEENITVVLSDRDPTFDDYTQSTFEQVYAFVFEGFRMERFERTTVGNLPAICMVYRFQVEGTEKKQYQYLINGVDNYAITFTEVETDLSEMVEESMGSFEEK